MVDHFIKPNTDNYYKMSDTYNGRKTSIQSQMRKRDKESSPQEHVIDENSLI